VQKERRATCIAQRVLRGAGGVDTTKTIPAKKLAADREETVTDPQRRGATMLWP